MVTEFKVSVIIPVYNAVNFLRRAVDSALKSPEVQEIILIDDGYPDGAIDLCRVLERENTKVKFYQHPGGANRGAGASRNLGISVATCAYIAFLDADDWYLENRFKESAFLFAQDDTVDGVYVPVGTALERGARPYFRHYRTKDEIERHISFTKKEITPDDLFSSLLRGRDGSFCTDGITLRKSLLAKAGLFNESLRLHQDYELWLRCAYFGKLVGVTSREPVAIRMVHNGNRIHKADIKSRAKYLQVVCGFFLGRRLRFSDRTFLLRESIIYHAERKHYNAGPLYKYAELLKLTALELSKAFFGVRTTTR